MRINGTREGFFHIFTQILTEIIHSELHLGLEEFFSFSKDITHAGTELTESSQFIYSQPRLHKNGF
jgi:hypothetical protein